jgi:hypothetical protein
LLLPPGSEVVYRVDAPIRTWRVYAFVEGENADLTAAGSSDGEHFGPLEVERRSFSSGAGDYGYLAPVLFQGSCPGGPTRLKIESGDGAAPVQIARVEIEYGG